MPTVHVSELFKLIPNWLDWAVEFEDYKVRSVLPDRFGRDERYRQEIWHMHLAHTLAIKMRWRRISIQFYRTTPTSQPQFDYWLIYAYDDFNDRYLMLTVIGPKAHTDPRFKAFIGRMQVDIVDPWLAGRVVY